MKKSVLISAIIIPCVLITLIIAAVSILNFFRLTNTDTAPVNKIFTNYTWGYHFAPPPEFVQNTQFGPGAMRFESDNTTIEVYTQSCFSAGEMNEYISYSNKAITENTTDYTDVTTFSDEKANTVLMWSRKKLSRIQNDKNHYLKLDIPKESNVYTILAKSTQPITDFKPYLDMISFHSESGNDKQTPKKTAAKRKFNKETAEFYDKYLSDSAGLTWGIFQKDYPYASSLAEYEEKIDHRFRLLLWYNSFKKDYDQSLVKGFVEKAHSEGRTVMLTLQPSLVHDVGNDLFRVLDGYYDSFLDSYAKDIAEFGHPVLFKFANEMNGDWCEYSAYQMSLDTELYRELYRYVYGFFEKHNADNVIWVWNPNGISFPNFEWNSVKMYYPGNDYVDALGLTLYNTGTFYEGETWVGFEELYTPLYEYSAKSYDMPFIVTEMACARHGGNKEEWTRNMLNSIEKFPNIKMSIWWNWADYAPDGQISRSYFIDDSQEMIDIFKKYFASQKAG